MIQKSSEDLYYPLRTLEVNFSWPPTDHDQIKSPSRPAKAFEEDYWPKVVDKFIVFKTVETVVKRPIPKHILDRCERVPTFPRLKAVADFRRNSLQLRKILETRYGLEHTSMLWQDIKLQMCKE